MIEKVEQIAPQIAPQVAPQVASERPTAFEFFAGGGMARLGLEAAGFECLFANDLDPMKATAYRENFGAGGFVEGDVAALRVGDLPPARPDLVWASFPCQDVSLAGDRRGMADGGPERSGVFWPFWRLVRRLDDAGLGPRVIVLENVVGLASSRGGADFTAVLEAIALSGRRFSALVVDGALFTPQSRPRLFIIAWPSWRNPAAAAGLERAAPAPLWTPPPLARALSGLAGVAALAHRPIDPAPPSAKPPALASILEAAPPDVSLASKAKVADLLGMMTPTHRDRVEAARARARATGAAQVGALYRRMRDDGQGGRAQRAEIRFDRAGCLRTPAGGSSRQTILIAQPDGTVDARLLSSREAARLMGLPDDYRLPARYNEAYRLAGDGVVVGVVRHLAETVAAPLIAAERPECALAATPTMAHDRGPDRRYGSEAPA